MDDGIGFIGWLIILAIIVFYVAAIWKIYEKAGQPGWAAIVPIYNAFVLLQIVGRPLWWIVLFFIPIVNFFISLVVYIDLAKSFGKSVAYGLGLFFLGFIFVPILGYGDAQYVGPAASA